MDKQLIFVLGSQRSGTNALRRSLSLDPEVMGFNEQKKSPFFENWFLRPEKEIRSLIREKPSKVLLKPIQNVKRWPVTQLLSDFKAYNLKVAWIYRDPVNVFASRIKRWPYLDSIDDFIDEWNRINKSALEAKAKNMAIVKYEELEPGTKVFSNLCKFMGVRGENLFRPAKNSEYPLLDGGGIEAIQAGTLKTLELINAARIKA